MGQPVPRVRPPVLWSSPRPSRIEILYEFGVLYVVTALQVTIQIPGFMLKRYEVTLNAVDEIKISPPLSLPRQMLEDFPFLIN